MNAIGGIAVTFVITGLDLLRKLPERLPGRARLVEMAAAYHLYARAWKPSLGAFALSIGAHVAYFATFYCAARAFTEAVSLKGLFIVMPVVNVIAALPISAAGVGVREGLFEQLLGNLYGVPGDIALLVSLTGFAIVVLWSALGGLIYLTYRPSEHARLSQIDAEVAKVEDKITQ